MLVIKDVVWRRERQLMLHNAHSMLLNDQAWSTIKEQKIYVQNDSMVKKKITTTFSFAYLKSLLKEEKYIRIVFICKFSFKTLLIFLCFLKLCKNNICVYL